jgi:hypothetical protein
MSAFLQELAKGKTADEAYQLAGYAENRGNAARLKANESIERRVGEILERSAITRGSPPSRASPKTWPRHRP